MGSSTSKPELVFHGETPVRFSSALVSTLESSGESNRTREASLELHVQERVASELKRLEARESEVFRSIGERIDDGAEHSTGAGLDREKVKAEIERLRRHLESLPKLRELEGGLKDAREGLKSCLVKNEEKPLDCYREVERFSEMARRWEKEFVVRTLGREY